MSKTLYIRRQDALDEIEGPYGLDQLRSLAESGSFAAADQVSPDGKKWFLATKIKPSLFPSAEPTQVTDNGSEDFFGSLPDAPEQEALVATPLAVPAYRAAPVPQHSPPAPEPSDTRPAAREAIRVPPNLIVYGAFGCIAALVIGYFMISTVAPTLTSAREIEFATNSSEPRTTSEWIEMLRKVYGKKRSVIRGLSATVAKQEAGKASNFVDFDPVATEALFDAVADPEQRVSRFASIVLRKANADNLPNKQVVFEQLTATDVNARRIATYLLPIIPGGVKENKETLEANLAGEANQAGDFMVRSYSLACLATVEGGSKTYLPKFQVLERSDRAWTLKALTEHQQGHLAIDWYSPEHNKGFETAGLALQLENIPATTRNSIALSALDRKAGSYGSREDIKGWFADIDASVADDLFDRLDHEESDIQTGAAVAIHTIAKKLPSEDAMRIVEQLEEFSQHLAQSDLLLALAGMREKARPAAAKLAHLMPQLTFPDNACTAFMNLGIENADLKPAELVELLSNLAKIIEGRAPYPHTDLDRPGQLMAKVAGILSKRPADTATLQTLRTHATYWKVLQLGWEQKALLAESQGRRTSVTVFIKGEYDASASAETQNEYMKGVAHFRYASQIVSTTIENLGSLITAGETSDYDSTIE